MSDPAALQLPTAQDLLDSPRSSLQSILLTALDLESQHAKRAKAEADAARKYGGMAEAIQWLIDFKEAIREEARKNVEMQPELKFPAEAAPTANWRPKRWPVMNTMPPREAKR